LQQGLLRKEEASRRLVETMNDTMAEHSQKFTMKKDADLELATMCAKIASLHERPNVTRDITASVEADCNGVGACLH
jgi:hypothetical protein